MVKFTVEKVLYLANDDKMLNVAQTEKPCTDLYMRVEALLKAGCLELVKEDKQNKYYRTTKAGKIQLLKLQIEWRKKAGKAVDLHELELATLSA